MLTGYSGDRPITYWGKIPVYVTTIVLAGLIAGLLLGTIVMVARQPLLFLLADLITFNAPQTWLGLQIWRVGTYPFLDSPNFFTIFSLAFVYFYGREIETMLGRSRTIAFYALMVVAPALFATLAWLLGYVTQLSGGYLLNIAVVIAFATVAPGLEMFGGIKMKWFAWFCFGLGAIQPLSGSTPDVGYLITYLCNCALAHGYIRWVQHGGSLPEFKLGKLFQRGPKMRVVRGGQSASSGGPNTRYASAKASSRSEMFEPGRSVPQAEVDRILEKVAGQGIGSLTREEKRLLEKHSADLNKRSGR